MGELEVFLYCCNVLIKVDIYGGNIKFIVFGLYDIQQGCGDMGIGVVQWMVKSNCVVVQVDFFFYNVQQFQVFENWQ